MANLNSKLSALLKQNNLSVTRQRQTIFDTLGNCESLSMKELINKTPAMMDRASVYRTVTLFEKLGIVQRINIGWKYRIELSDKFADHHHHLVCTKCSKIIPIDADNLEVFIEQVAAQNKFKAINHQVEIQGLCNKCRD